MWLFFRDNVYFELIKKINMKKIVMLFMALICVSKTFSQKIDENKNFIYKTNGEVIYGRNIDYKTPLFKKKYLLIDDVKIFSKEVKFYKSERGFFGSLENIRSGFAQRIMKGKINYFEQVTMSNSTAMPMNGGFGMTMSTPTTSISNFYNMGYEPLKSANYENLIVDLKSNVKSVLYLEKYHNAKKKRTLGYVLGGIAMAAGILTSTKKTGETNRSFNPNTGRIEDTAATEIKPVNLVIGLAGFGTIIANYLSSRKKRDYIRRAIETYNE